MKDFGLWMKEKNENKSEKKEEKKKAAEWKAEMKKAAERNEILLNEILDVLRTDGRTPVADAAAGGSALAHD
jgi:hypothetical protein